MSAAEVRCRPLDRWDGEHTANRRVGPYAASWSRIVKDLEAELDHLDASDVTLGIDVRHDQIRVDGWPKGNASVPAPVVLTFESKVGPIRMQCDRWSHWQDNVRAIGLTLQRLRLVDEGGVARSGEQYRGWQALPPGTPMPAARMTVDEAVELLCDEAHQGTMVIDDPEVVQAVWRRAVREHHPDVGGDPETFRRLTEARDLLLEEARR